MSGWLTTRGEAVDAQLQVKDDYDKEVSKSFEIGSKMEFFERRLRVNAAVLQTDVEDNQFFEFFPGITQDMSLARRDAYDTLNARISL